MPPAALSGQLPAVRATGHVRGQAVATARALLAEAGIPVAEHKTEGSATSVTFLGILVNTVQFQLQLPSDKLSRLQVMIRQWLDRRSCTTVSWRL